MNNKSILILGASSFAAKELHGKLETSGHSVFAFYRGKLHQEGNRIYGTTSELSSNPFIPDIDVVINFIIIKDGDISANEKFFQNLLDFCEKKRVKQLIHISSISCFSSASRDIYDNTPIETEPEKKGSYGSLKVAADQYLHRHRPSCLKITYLRPGFIIAPGMVSPIIGMGFRFGKNQLLLIGDEKNCVPVTSRELVHEAIAKIVLKEQKTDEKTLMVVDESSPTRFEWMEASCSILGVAQSIVSIPVLFWKIAGLGGEICMRILGVKIHPWTIVQNACRRMVFHPKHSEEYLGMKFDLDWRKSLQAAFENQQPVILPIPREIKKESHTHEITFIGFGGIVKQRHLDALRKIGFSGKIEAFDLHEDQYEDILVRYLDTYSSNVKTDLTIVATPGTVHHQAISLLTGNQMPVIIEKPLCYGRDEYLQWIEFASKRQSLTAVCHNYRFKRNVVAFLNLLQKYNPGKLLHVHLDFQSPGVSMDSASWRRNERKARTLLMDYSLHFLDMACMFDSKQWMPQGINFSLNSSGETSFISGTMKSSMYDVSFILRQGFQPRRCSIFYTFQNYSVSVGFFPDVMEAYMTDGSAGVHKEEAEHASSAFREKVMDKLLHRNSDISHALLFSNVLEGTDAAQSISVASLEAFYQGIFQLGDIVYGN